VLLPARVSIQLLEGCFLASAVVILVAGMVFTSGGFAPGTTGYNLLSIALALTIIVATLAFMMLLGFEIYRSVKLSEAHVLARRVEEEAVEQALLSRRRRSTVVGSGPGPGPGGRRRSSVFGGDLQREASLARRFDMVLGVPSPAGELWMDRAHDGGAGADPESGSVARSHVYASPTRGGPRTPPVVVAEVPAPDHPAHGSVPSTAVAPRRAPPPPPPRPAPPAAEGLWAGGPLSAGMPGVVVTAARSARVQALMSSRAFG
jgi:hypothetical protein